MNKFNKVTKAMGLRYAELINCFPLCLEDFASSEFDSLPPHIRADFDQTVDRLKLRFSHPEQLTHNSSQLMGKQQQPKQTITSYANQLRVLGQQCYSNFERDVVDRILRDIFVN